MGSRLFIAAALLFAACSSEPVPEASELPGRATEPPPQAAPAPSSDALIVAFGDSLTAGYGLRSGESYPELLERELQDRGFNYRVVNEGISGDTTAAGLTRVDLAAARKPRYVILAFGANDGLRGLSIERMEANLRTMIDQFETSGAAVILAGMRLPPNFGRDYVRDFEAVYPKLAHEMNIPLIPFLLEGVAAEQSLNQPDGIHPNAEGTRRVARTVADFLQTILTKEPQ